MANEVLVDISINQPLLKDLIDTVNKHSRGLSQGEVLITMITAVRIFIKDDEHGKAIAMEALDKGVIFGGPLQ